MQPTLSNVWCCRMAFAIKSACDKALVNLVWTMKPHGRFLKKKAAQFKANVLDNSLGSELQKHRRATWVRQGPHGNAYSLLRVVHTCISKPGIRGRVLHVILLGVKACQTFGKALKRQEFPHVVKNVDLNSNTLLSHWSLWSLINISKKMCVVKVRTVKPQYNKFRYTVADRLFRRR